jgi:NAD+ diphosphatase
MAINLHTHAFAGNPLRSKTPKPEDPFSPISALETLKTQLLDTSHSLSSPAFKVLPFLKGRPLASSSGGLGDLAPNWQLGWIGLDDCKGYLANSGVQLSADSLVYLGSRPEDDIVYWGIDVSGEGGLVPEFGSKQLSFVELRTLMVATDWADEQAMGELAIAGHVSAYGYLMRIVILLDIGDNMQFCSFC